MTVTFADTLIPTHPKRECFINLTPLSVWRKPTKGEQEKSPNIIQLTDLLFFRFKLIGVRKFYDL